jgi:hypothetical protein
VDVLIGELIPLAAIVLGIGIGIVAIIAKHRRDVRELELRHRERMAAIEKGLDLPPDPVSSKQPTGDRHLRGGGSRYLLRGLVWVGIGLAVALTEDEMTYRFHSWGWIAAAVGMAYLIYYFIEGRKAELRPPSARPPGDGSEV